MPTPIDIANPVEIVREHDFLATASAQHHGSSVNSQGV
jgi:hypothetical protein